MASQQKASQTPLEMRDRFRTPAYLFNWANSLFDFQIDLAADDANFKVDNFLSLEDDSLSVDWHKHQGYGWCNPPYSEPKKWLKKGWGEAQKGFNTAFLVPTANGEDAYRDFVFGKASEIIFINGRIAFIAAGDFTIKGKNGKPDRIIKEGDPVSGNTRGSCLIVYNRRYEGQTMISTINRDDLREKFS